MGTTQTTGSEGLVEPGQILDQYRLDALVAESAMARTFRATDLRDGRTVAIKVPEPSIETDPVALERFRREEEIGTSLNHPDVMRIFHVDHRSRLYLVMEWCEGHSLSEILAQQPKLSPDRAIRITLGILRALDHIHQHGIVHRDLEPAHIIVDDRDRIKLIDFGVASQQGASRITFTSISQVAGSPEYISPEQVRGKRGDSRSDLYAAGVMLYQMLTGTKPFTGAAPMAIMNARLSRNLPPLPLADFPLAPQLNEVLCRATEREPHNRYASAQEFAHDLEHLDMVGVAERAAPGSSPRKSSKSPSRLLLYTAIALVPILIFLVMLMLAR
jgi:serine/threonine-protein kinase